MVRIWNTLRGYKDIKYECAGQSGTLHDQIIILQILLLSLRIQRIFNDEPSWTYTSYIS